MYLAKTIPNRNIVGQLEYCLSPNDVNIPEPPGLNVFVKGLAAIKIGKEYIENAQVLAMLIREGKEESDNDDTEEETDGKEEESEQAENEREHDDTAPLKKPRRKCESIVKTMPYTVYSWRAVERLLRRCASM